MPNGNFMVADVADITPEIIGQEALGMLDAGLKLANLVTRDTSLEKARAGMTASVPMRGALVRNEKVSGENVTKQKPSISKKQVSLKHWEVTFSLEDMVKTITPQGLELDLGFIQDSLVVLCEGIESDIATLFATAGLTAIGDGTTALDENMVLEAGKTLTDLKAPQSGRAIAASTTQSMAAKKIDRFTAADKVGTGVALTTGVLGIIHGFQWVETPFVTAAAGVEIGAAFHKYGIVLASREIQSFIPKGLGGVTMGVVEKDGIKFRVSISFDPNGLATQFTIDTLYGVDLLRDDLVLAVKTVA